MCGYVHTDEGLMLRSELYGKAADAALDIARSMVAPVAKALDPLDRADFITITQRLHKKLRGEALPPERDVVLRAIETLDLDWNGLSTSQKSAAFDAFNQALAGLVPARMTAAPILVAEAEPLVKSVKESTIRRFRLDLDNTFTRADERVARSTGGLQGNFITDHTGQIVEDTTAWARKRSGELIEQGLSSRDIAAALSEGVAARTLGKASNYWNVVATSFVGRARSYEQATAYAEAQIDFYVWESVLDERTTEICRFMHGKRFSTQAALDRYRAAEAAARSGGARAFKDAQPWMTMSRDKDGNRVIVARTSKETHVIAQVDEPGFGEVDRIGSYSNAMGVETLESLGVTMPPAHGMCRSTVVADV